MGNHDNYDMIEKLPEIEIFANKVLKVSDNIFYLKRGEIYQIEDKSFLVLGGAKSEDKEYRIPHESWWQQEELCEEEKAACFEKIKKSDRKFDYVLSHTGTTKGITCIAPSCSAENDKTVNFNDTVDSMISYKKWFFGHWHSDLGFDNYANSKFVPLYHKGIVL